jgi:hypothetical protein
VYEARPAWRATACPEFPASTKSAVKIA